MHLHLGRFIRCGRYSLICVHCQPYRTFHSSAPAIALLTSYYHIIRAPILLIHGNLRSALASLDNSELLYNIDFFYLLDRLSSG